MRRWGYEEGVESSLRGRLEASKERWRDEIVVEMQKVAFNERWRDDEGAESSLQGRLEASKMRLRDEEAAEM